MAFDTDNSINSAMAGLRTTTDLTGSIRNHATPEQNTIGAQAIAATRAIADPEQRSLLTDMIGSNPLNADVARASAQAVGVVSSSAGATSANAVQASSLKTNLHSHIENTKEAIRDAQAPVREQLDQAFDSMAGPDGTLHFEGADYTKNDVRGGFSSASNNISDGAQAASIMGGSLIPGAAGKATASASVVADVREAAGVGNGKLPVKLQNILSERLAQIQIQDHESGKHPLTSGMRERIADAAASSALQMSDPMRDPNQPTALTQLYEEMLQPPENFPEVQAMMNTERSLAGVVAEHTAEAPNVGAALSVQAQTGTTISLEDAEAVADRIPLVAVALTDDIQAPVTKALNTVDTAEMLERRSRETAIPALEVPKPQQAQVFQMV
jgi:hypothetical protein